MNLTELDDPRPFVPTPELRRRVEARTRQLHRRRAIGRVAAALTAIGLAAGGLASVELAPTRVRVITPGSDSVPATDPDVGGATSTAPVTAEPATATASAPVDIVVVGVDRRADDSEVSGSRGDTILVVRLDPVAGTRHVLSIPRDLLVTDPTTGRRNRINSLVGTRPSLVQAVEALTDEHIEHYVELDFDAFTALADAVGGFDLAFAAPLRDRGTGFEVSPGCTHLDGSALLRYARSRHLEQQRPDGTWTSDGTGDVGRIARQGDLVRRVTTRLLDGGGLDVVDAATKVLPKLVVDDGLDLGELRRLTRLARSLDATPVAWSTVPAHHETVTIGGYENDVLVADASAASGPDAATTTAAAILPIDDPSCGGRSGS